jgi:ElaB/YqjD/DUF883 family membrane-anchored ribosome-binding protein
MSILTSIPTIASDCSSEVAECKKVIDAADAALKAKDELLDIQKHALDASETFNIALRQQVDTKDEQLSSITRNPFAMGAVGAVAGILLYGLLHK